MYLQFCESWIATVIIVFIFIEGLTVKSLRQSGNLVFQWQSGQNLIKKYVFFFLAFLVIDPVIRVLDILPKFQAESVVFLKMFWPNKSRGNLKPHNRITTFELATRF